MGQLSSLQAILQPSQKFITLLREIAPKSGRSDLSVGSPMAWILTIARNLSLMELRRGTRETTLGDEEWCTVPADTPRVTAEDRIVLEEALAALTDDERRVIMLHVTSGLKHREIASLLELPLSTVLSKYNRAMKKLRRALGRYSEND